MIKVVLIALVCSIVTFVSYLAIYTRGTAAAKCCSNSAPERPQIQRQIPEYLPYSFLFQHLANIKDQQREVDNYFAKSGLEKTQILKTLEIASRYQQEVSILDQQAQVIIDNFHAKYPPGRMP